MSVVATRIVGADADRRGGDPRLALFSVMWALAAMFHVVGNTSVGSTWSHALLAVAAGLVLWRPGSVGALATLAGCGVVTVWEEAPVLGNHWLLAGFVDLVILMAVAMVMIRRRWHEPADLANRIFPAARLCLVAFYAFASFAKINGGFFHRATSCAVVFFGESTESVRLGSLRLGGAAWLEWAVIGGTVAVELAIPILLVMRRTRHLGVVVGLVFHALVAVDRAHQFFDFSSVLVALFVLFLPASASEWVAERVGSVRARLALVDGRAPRAVHVALAVAPALLALIVALGQTNPHEALNLGWWPWQLYAVACIVLTMRYLRQQRPPRPEARSLRPHHAAFLIVPVLVIANGLTPYLELKTGYGWNMYSNMRTVDGDSNHYVVRRTLPLTDEQQDLVHIIDTNDPGLGWYADRDYALTWNRLRVYLSAHPGISITYDRGQERVALQHAYERPELVESIPRWREKAQLFRAVDLSSPERCATTFGPAR